MNARDSCILPRSYNERYLIGSVFNFFSGSIIIETISVWVIFWQHYCWNNFSLSDPRRYNECYLNGSVFIYLFFSGSIIGVVQMVNKKSGVFTASGDYVIKRSELVTRKLGIKRFDKGRITSVKR